jgi:hypothetical protein
MNPTSPSATPPRQVYMVLSPRALGYARLALRTLLTQSDEPLHLRLITDSAEDKRTLETAVAELAPEARHTVVVIAEEELADAEAKTFGSLENLRRFRHGHPCWRKITDPLLIGAPGDELVLLDPDLLFPNRFRFEPTPASGVLLMWQRPNCLLPPEVVRAAIHSEIRLARHVDIGVSHWRLSPGLEELEWVDWLVGKLGGASLPRAMHVEAIVWSAIAMRFGGGYLNPDAWVCWHRTQTKRLRRKLGASGQAILRAEDWSRMKCFHAGGEAKWWLDEAQRSGLIKPGQPQLAPTPNLPFVELTESRYEGEQRAKNLIGNLGYYRLFGAGGQ